MKLSWRINFLSNVFLAYLLLIDELPSNTVDYDGGGPDRTWALKTQVSAASLWPLLPYIHQGRRHGIHEHFRTGTITEETASYPLHLCVELSQVKEG